MLNNKIKNRGKFSFVAMQKKFDKILSDSKSLSKKRANLLWNIVLWKLSDYMLEAQLSPSLKSWSELNQKKNQDYKQLGFYAKGDLQKKSREQFELSSYKRLLDIYSSSPKTIDALMKLELPSGVEVEIKV